MKLLQMEFYKCRRRKFPLLCLAWLLVQALWLGVTVFHGMDAAEKAVGWQMLCYNLALTDAITLPILISAILSRSCEMEHKGTTWKLLETLTAPGSLYRAKLAWYVLVITGLLALRLGFFLLLGAKSGFSAPLPLGQLLGFALPNWAVSVMLGVLQLGLSLRFANQAIALVCGILGSFVGLMSMFFPVWVERIVPWGYYGLLSNAGLSWDATTRVSDFYWRQPEPGNWLLLGLWFCLFLLLGRTIFSRKEV